MIIFNIIFAIFLPTFLGVAFIQSLQTHKKLSHFLTIPLGFGLGLAVFSHWMLLLSIVGIPYSRFSIGFPWLVIGVLLLVKNHFRNKRGELQPVKLTEPQYYPKTIVENIFNILFTFFIFFTAMFVCVRSLSIPVLNWDALSWIALKGKIFFFEKSIYQHAHLPNSAYPMHTSLSLTWSAFNLGQWNETLIKLIFPVYFIAYSMIHYYIARLYSNKLWAKGSLALLMSSSFFVYHSTIAYRDITIMYYFCSSILLILLWYKIKDKAPLIMSALFLGFATFVKLEGALYMGIGLLILFYTYLKHTSFKEIKNWITLSSISLISVFIFLYYYIYKAIIGAHSYTQNLNILSLKTLPYKSYKVLDVFLNELFRSANWHIIWFVLLLSVIQMKKVKKSVETKILLTSIFTFFCVYFVLGSLTGLYDSLLGIGSSGVTPRVILHIYPLAVMSITLINVKTEE